MLLLSSADFFQNKLFSNNSFRNTIRVSNGLDPDQGHNCLQRLPADKIFLVAACIRKEFRIEECQLAPKILC